LPFSINGVEATSWFDTGANFSVPSEAEAKRFGLQIRYVSAKGRVSTGAEVGFRIEFADQLSFGGIVVKNAEFLVFPDDQPPFKDDRETAVGLIPRYSAARAESASISAMVFDQTRQFFPRTSLLFSLPAEAVAERR
jgi:hypothetical protein